MYAGIAGSDSVALGKMLLHCCAISLLYHGGIYWTAGSCPPVTNCLPFLPETHQPGLLTLPCRLLALACRLLVDWRSLPGQTPRGWCCLPHQALWLSPSPSCPWRPPLDGRSRHSPRLAPTRQPQWHCPQPHPCCLCRGHQHGSSQHQQCVWSLLACCGRSADSSLKLDRRSSLWWTPTLATTTPVLLVLASLKPLSLCSAASL